MYSITHMSGKAVNGLCEVFCDNEGDIKNLPTDIAPGSTAIVIATGNVFILNCSHEWVEPGNIVLD